MVRGALRLGAFLSALTPCVTALGHGEPPVAYAVISHDAQGARAVRLSAGVALRRGAQRFQYVCPSAWGDQYGAPVAALSDGTIVIDSTNGLMLLSEDGKVRAHPDPTAVGDSNDVVHSARGVFSLRTTPQGSEVLAVDAQKARVLWKDTKNLYSIAALDDKLVLLRANGMTLEQVTIAAADGAELERQMAPVAAPIDYVFARANAGAAYALVVFRTSSALGTLHMNTFEKLVEAELSLPGPLKIGNATLVAPDGKFSDLVSGQAKPLMAEYSLLCLEQNDELAYACHHDGIARVDGRSLGEQLFQFTWLVPPNVELLPAGDARTRCNAQWQDLRVDLLMIGISLPEDAVLEADAGSALADAGIADSGIAIAPDAALPEAGVEVHEAGINDGAALTHPGRSSESAGCTARAVPRAGSGYTALAQLVLALFFVRRRSSPRLR